MSKAKNRFIWLCCACTAWLARGIIIFIAEMGLSKIYKVNHNVAGRLQHLAERLGLLRAAPRDVVHLHVAVMRKKIAELPRTNAQAYIEAGRLALLELMGDLVSYYRLRISPRAGSRISAQSGEEAS